MARQAMSTRRFVTNIFFWEQESWAEAYMAAMLEDSPVELPHRIATAHAEIGARLAVLVGQEHSVARKRDQVDKDYVPVLWNRMRNERGYA